MIRSRCSVGDGAVPYLSRIHLNPLRRDAQRLLRSPQVVHAAVLGGIAQQPVQERTLWRLERDGTHRLSLLVLTQSRPSFEHIVEQSGWPGADMPQVLTRDLEPLLGRLSVGREFGFRLRANTVSSKRQPLSSNRKDSRGRERPARGVRVPERTAAHQLAWFRGRLPRWGFEITGHSGEEALRLTGRERLVFAKSEGDSSRQVVLQTADAEGVIRVRDPSAARAAVLLGCGPGRSYGCGLLTLASVWQES